KESTQVKRLKKEEGHPGRIWKSKQMELWDDIDKNDQFIRHNAAKSAKIKSALGIPLFHIDEFIGCMVFFCQSNSNTYLDTVKPFVNLKAFLGAQIKRKQQEEELTLLFESSPDIMAIASTKDRFVKANPAFCELLGYTEEEITSRTFSDFLHPDDLKQTKSEYDETISGERNARNFTNRYRTKTGEYRWISWSSSDPFGEDDFVFAYGRDVTEIKELEKLLETATKLARLGFWEVDVETESSYYSKVACEIHEVSENYQPNFETALAFYRKDYQDYVVQSVEEAIHNGTDFEYEAPIITAKGNEVWVKCIGKIEYRKEKQPRLFGSVQDITVSKLQEDEIVYQNQMLSALNHVIAKLLSEDNWYNILDEVFDYAGRSVEVDRVYYFENHKNEVGELLASQRFEWTRKNIKAEINNPNLQNMSVSIFEDFTKEIYERGYFQAIVREMNESYFKNDLQSQNILAILIIPLFIDGEFYGFIGFDDCSNEREWNEAEINFLRSVASNLSNAIRRRTYKVNLEKAYEERNQILESIGDAFFSVDKYWIVTYWNQKAEEVLLTPKDTILNKNLWEVFEDAVDLKFYTAYHKVMNDKVIEHFEEYFPPLKKWFDVSAYPSKEGVSVFFRDVTERKKIEDEIRQSNERFEKVAEATNDAIWDFNSETGKSYWGKGFETLFGLNLKKMDPGFEQLVKLMHPEDQNRIREESKEFYHKQSETKWYAEFRLMKGDGTYAYVIDRGNFFRNEKGEIVRGVGAMTDITYRKEYEDSLEELNAELKERARELAISNADLEQFAFVASHDLQEPLRMVSSFLTQLEKKYGDQLDERAHKYIDFAVDGSMRMKQIILDILEYSRVGKQEEEKQLLDLNEVVEDVKKILKASIDERKVTIEFNKLPKMNTYAGPLLQIMQNLINNAIKYTSPEQRPQIQISGEARKDDWLIVVSDNGIGIDADYYEKIFMIFQRLHTKKTYKGSGMGLAIVKKNIDKLGGEIWVDSEVGKGSTFYFTIKK
ncbi:MAG: PAS domain S-box protein, partial [Vicingaceae bacterium]